MAKKTDKNIQARRAYVKLRISNTGLNLKSEVSRIARDLFISERTVYRDFYSKKND